MKKNINHASLKSSMAASESSLALSSLISRRDRHYQARKPLSSKIISPKYCKVIEGTYVNNHNQTAQIITFLRPDKKTDEKWILGNRKFWSSDNKLSPKNITLQPISVRDEKFINDLTYHTMLPYVEATWPGNAAAHEHYFEINKCNPVNTRIVQLDGKDIGRISTTLLEDSIFIDEIHILPEYQGQGIATKLISDVFDEADDKNVLVALTVLKVNPAQKLYRKMGFVTVPNEDPNRFHMKRYSLRQYLRTA